MIAKIDSDKPLNTSRKHYWAVWVDDRNPTIVSSRAKAKRLCAKAKSTSYFCRWGVKIGPTERPVNMKISDFIVWQFGSDGCFRRHMYLLTDEMLNGLTVQPYGFSLNSVDYARYKRALSNLGMWKLGSEPLLKSFGNYPEGLVEVTSDSDTGMLCAGYYCVGEVSNNAELCAIFKKMDSQMRCCGTVDGNTLKIWAEVCYDNQDSSFASSGAVSSDVGITAI